MTLPPTEKKHDNRFPDEDFEENLQRLLAQEPEPLMPGDGISWLEEIEKPPGASTDRLPLQQEASQPLKAAVEVSDAHHALATIQSQTRKTFVMVLKEGVEMVVTGAFLLGFLSMCAMNACYEKMFGKGPSDHLKD